MPRPPSVRRPGFSVPPSPGPKRAGPAAISSEPFPPLASDMTPRPPDALFAKLNAQKRTCCASGCLGGWVLVSGQKAAIRCTGTCLGRLAPTGQCQQPLVAAATSEAPTAASSTAANVPPIAVGDTVRPHGLEPALQPNSTQRSVVSTGSFNGTQVSLAPDTMLVHDRCCHSSHIVT